MRAPFPNNVEFDILLHLDDGGPTPIFELSKALGRPQPIVRRTLADLADRGMVSQSGRAMPWCLTGRGVEAVEHLRRAAAVWGAP